MHFPGTTKQARVLVQGATGREGTRAVDFMKRYHTNVVAGVTPGKGGQEVAGVPIFDTVREAVSTIPTIEATSLYVPPSAALPATRDALDVGIRFVHVLTEGIPLRDIASMIALCKEKGALLLGPGSLGILVEGIGRIGMLGGIDPQSTLVPGSTSVICRSGGMTNEIMQYLCQQGTGIRIALHLGSEINAGTSLVEAITLLEDDEKTGDIIVFEEITHADLADLVALYEGHLVHKPVTITLVGQSLSLMPPGASFGHLDSLLHRDDTLLFRNIAALKQLGVKFIDSYEDYAMENSNRNRQE